MDDFQVISDEIPVGVWKTDSAGMIRLENKKASDLFGASLLGKNILDLLSEKQKEDFNFFCTLGCCKLEFVLNNDENWFKLKIKKLPNNEMVGIVTDITAEKITMNRLLAFKYELQKET